MCPPSLLKNRSNNLSSFATYRKNSSISLRVLVCMREMGFFLSESVGGTWRKLFEEEFLLEMVLQQAKLSASEPWLFHLESLVKEGWTG